MKQASVTLVALLLVPVLLLMAMMHPSGDDRRQRLLGSEEIAGIRLVLYPLSFQVRLARVHSGDGSAVELVWSVEIRKGSAPPIAQSGRGRAPELRDEVSP